MAAKPLQPFTVQWGNNVVDTAVALDVQISSDDLLNTCILNYQILNSNNYYVSTGQATITGQDYEDWDGNNDYPFTFIANKLNLILETPTPTPTPTSTPTPTPSTTVTI